MPIVTSSLDQPDFPGAKVLSSISAETDPDRTPAFETNALITPQNDRDSLASDDVSRG